LIQQETINLNIQTRVLKKNALHFAVERNCDLEIIKMLVENGIDYNQVDALGRSPIYYSKLFNDRLNIFNYLFNLININLGFIDVLGFFFFFLLK
jgi:ankyrin repeat protein